MDTMGKEAVISNKLYNSLQEGDIAVKRLSMKRCTHNIRP